MTIKYKIFIFFLIEFMKVLEGYKPNWTIFEENIKQMLVFAKIFIKFVNI